MQSALTFTDSDNLVWPIVGNVLINYSMDKTVYFPTLEQYKYNPAIIIQADEGEIITAAAGGKVTRVFEDREIGNAVTMELGDGYELTYGQLGNILVSEGSFVAAGDVVAEVAAPTKYYSVEGTNVYFKLTKDGDPVNPMTKLE
jgi:septal ring factor EnvC (AmiA/AmiB activator)